MFLDMLDISKTQRNQKFLVSKKNLCFSSDPKGFAFVWFLLLLNNILKVRNTINEKTISFMYKNEIAVSFFVSEHLFALLYAQKRYVSGMPEIYFRAYTKVIK